MKRPPSLSKPTTITAQTRVLIVDDHPIVRDHLKILLNSQADMVVCGEAEDRHGALRAIQTTNPNLAIVDLSLKHSNGMDLISDIRKRWPRLLVLVLSMHDDPLYAHHAIGAGAQGYMHKQEAASKVLVAIRKVLNNETYLSENLAAALGSKLVGRTNAQRSGVDGLSQRELRVFGLIGMGHSNSQICEQLGLHKKTVDTYCARIKEKLHISDAIELRQIAIRWAHRNGATLPEGQAACSPLALQENQASA
jgi:DNA-binding NarL/FixJ family response regulator